MIKNISISAFINTIFILALFAIVIILIIFIKFDKEKYHIFAQKKNEIVAEKLLSTLKNNPSKRQFRMFAKEFEVKVIQDEEIKLDIINNASALILRRTGFGIYRVFLNKNDFFIYIQNNGYNIMLKDLQTYSYNIAILALFIILPLGILFFLFFIIKKKLKPLKKLNKQIKKFSNGDLNVKISSNSTDEIGTIAKNFNEAVLHINNQRRSKDLFMRNLMHELKTPITKAMFIAEKLDNGKDKDILQRAFKRMDDIIKELATVEKLTSQNTTIFKERTNFLQVYKKTLEIMLINSSNIDTKIDDFLITLDISMFSIVLKNLIDNAIKFSKNSQAILLANKHKIDISSYGNPLTHELSYYTEAFSQEEKRSDGFGLGLYIVQTIVNLHSYKLMYNHHKGLNTFTILLP